MKAIDLLTPEINELIQEYSALSKLNHFLAHNEDCNKAFAKLANNQDRWQLVSRINQIERLLIPDINRLFNGKKCTISIGDKSVINGIIKHELTRVYDNRTLDNEVSFRSTIIGDPLSGDTIALKVDTGDKYTSHLYNINQIEIIE